jgi:molybdopterin adenylyltransferase
MTIKIGIVTVSDRASKGIYEDISGQYIKQVMDEYLLSDWVADYRIIPDEQQIIEDTFRDMAAKGCCLILSTGGTGPAPRDVTTEATEAVCQKLLPGFGELMRKVSLEFVPTAILSRQTAGILDKSLIINMPGKPASIRTCLEAVFPAVPYCIDLIEGPYLEANAEAISVFRPKK